MISLAAFDIVPIRPKHVVIALEQRRARSQVPRGLERERKLMHYYHVLSLIFNSPRRFDYRVR
jgi:hypothetical protein